MVHHLALIKKFKHGIFSLNDEELSLLLTLADCNAQVVNRRVRGRSLPWITPTIKDLMKKRDCHHKKAIETNKELHWSSYKRLRNALSMKLHKGKASYYSKQLCEKQDSR